MSALERHAEWKAACAEAQAIRERLPIPYMCDDNREQWCEIRDNIQSQWFAADRAQRAAFQALANALPDVAPYRWVKWTPARRDHFRASRIWHTGQLRWYPVIETLSTDEAGVEYRIAAEMFDDAVEEAARRNAAWTVYYAKQAA